MKKRTKKKPNEVNIGVLVGYSKGARFNKCRSSGKIKIMGQPENINAGGLVGKVENTEITDSSSDVTIETTQGSLTFHNIKVDQSVIGSINTGEVKHIDVCMTHIKTSGNEELVKALKDFTEAVISETKLNNDLKNQILEQTSFLASQSVLPKEKRKTAIIKAVLSSLKDRVSLVASLASLWGKLQPLFDRFCSLG